MKVQIKEKEVGFFELRDEEDRLLLYVWSKKNVSENMRQYYLSEEESKRLANFIKKQIEEFY
jgi:hypothetical protein